MIKYIPDLDQEEETLITAKVDATLERLKKRMKVNRIIYIDKESKISLTFKVESHLRS
ncbi:hypothetical protein [Acinetobacter vivianii]|uniref:hypothetical protein n=1 Tax=Acinetobacter vivianii TaxID=1776742 RepID=UPI001903D448|nr:hypothetical protein [Acinetobacter vivianii]MBJ8482607.1 hypothetical protein [Acinetobacter vivianii]